MKHVRLSIAVVLFSGIFQSLFPVPPHIAGAYLMLSQSVTDGTRTENYNTHQLKIYTDRAVMYANLNPQDSSSSFGVGFYTENGNNVQERIIYAASGSNTDDTVRNFTLHIEPTADGYKQVIPNIDGEGKYTLTEVYKSMSTGKKSAMDGAWKQTKSYEVTNHDTTQNPTVIQYKCYYDGHFVWGHTEQYEGKMMTAIGYGKFDTKGSGIEEKIEQSTFSNIVGQAFQLNIKMMGNDAFRQTIQYSDSTVGVEEYTRLQ